MKQLEMLYEGKAKQVFATDDPEKIIIHYTDAATAFNNIKKATIENKGVLNNAAEYQIQRNEYMNQLYSTFGMSGSYPTDLATVRSQLVESYIETSSPSRRLRPAALTS